MHCARYICKDKFKQLLYYNTLNTDDVGIFLITSTTD